MINFTSNIGFLKVKNDILINTQNIATIETTKGCGLDGSLVVVDSASGNPNCYSFWVDRDKNDVANLAIEAQNEGKIIDLTA